ncbi:metallophosphoesterase family protein [Fictibacillus barbaricus]|uniref:3',5'-cyclic AMP phosphodiesterase CpdA n=1 Tax=Fictibacillus barbaricus TaxID=182136 RepID=A0ABU1TVQ2_9BACL|nr:metallophosphoesterase [Fictibacillus barbaricus]MDR7071293.1 3',5'-cyclic AMP phosphodiesterase CpdA [Fictibacillus barbaricus]
MKRPYRWKTKLTAFIIALAMTLPAGQASAYFSGIEKQDGGMGNTTHYLDEVPNIALDPKIDNIIYPLMATPAIKKNGSELTVKVDTKGKEPAGWNISLNPVEDAKVDGSFNLPVKSVKKGSSYWKESSSIYEVTVSIPDDVPEELFDLQVAYTGDGSRITDDEPNSVKIIKEFKKDFTFIHLTDIHVGSPRNVSDPNNATEAGMWDPDLKKRWLYLQKTIRQVNLLKPDFVVLTGDLMFGQMNPKEYIYEYEETYRILKQFNVPVYIVPGNHDYYAQDATLADGAKYWEQYFGPQYFSFDYGPYAHMIGYNSFDWDKFDRQGHGTVSVPTWGGQVREQQMDWIKKDLAENKATASAEQIKGLFSHHNPIWRDRDIWPTSDPEVVDYWKEYDAKHNPQNLTTLIKGEKIGNTYDQQWHGEGAHELIDVMKQNNVDISLHGHTHVDNITEQDGILYSTTSSIELTGKPWVGYRLFEKDPANKKFNSYVYEGPDKSMPVYENGNTSAGVVSFENNFKLPNDGSQSTQTATVTNRLNKPITISMPFYMTQGSYTPSKGEVIESQLYGTKQYVEVKVSIPAHSTQTIELNR